MELRWLFFETDWLDSKMLFVDWEKKNFQHRKSEEIISASFDWETGNFPLWLVNLPPPKVPPLEIRPYDQGLLIIGFP